MSRECSSTETYDTTHLDFVHDDLVVISELCDESIGSVDSLCPLVSLNSDFDTSLHVACKVFARPYGLDCS